jgi:hypothetical protein
VQVFIFPGTAAQAAVACVLALMSLVAVAKLDPLADATDAMLYMTGCIIIFLSMFMSLLIRGEQSVHHSHNSVCFEPHKVTYAFSCASAIALLS